MATFRNPGAPNAKIKKTNNLLVLLGCFLFGPLFFMAIGEWGHGIVTLIFSVPLWFVFAGWLIHLIWLPFSLNIVSKKWIRKGWVED